ncbi:MAG TPA: FGGY family carbohydrate kinase [Puia sp.]|nr:FGGY family carbohydrate kinase [Puia sp.]
MSKLPVIAIFDVGKTNKKIFLFNEEYKTVWEDVCQLEETRDEDHDRCENIELLSAWIKDSINQVLAMDDFQVDALNCSTYGASFVHIDAHDKVITPLYNYLKAYPDKLQKQFYEKYGPEEDFALATASPVLGSLNSGMQLYRLKYEQPALFHKIRFSLHLPQFLSSLLSGEKKSDITSIGCHTMLWDFDRDTYHEWVGKEGILDKLAEIFPSDQPVAASWNNHSFIAGIGLHDSSAALIPYLMSFEEPFILLSTGTWNISLNPFNQFPLRMDELGQDCLSYLEYKGKRVKASRLFAGYDHEIQTKRLGEYFQVAEDHYQSISFDAGILQKLESQIKLPDGDAIKTMLPQSVFAFRDLSSFENYATAYHQLIRDIMLLQKQSTQLVLENSQVKRIFVDGGFGKNPVFMHLLSMTFPHIEVYAATLAQASALGAALSIHQHWNKKPLPADLIELKFYSHPGSQ